MWKNKKKYNKVKKNIWMDNMRNVRKNEKEKLKEE